MRNDELKKIKKEVKGAWLPFIIYTRARGGRKNKNIKKTLAIIRDLEYNSIIKIGD